MTFGGVDRPVLANAAFGLAFNNLNGKVAKPHKPLALVLTPTRELA